MKILLMLVGLFLSGVNPLAAADEPGNHATEQEVRSFGEHLATLTPEQKAAGIIQWWDLHEAEFRPSPQVKSIRFFDEMTACRQAAIPALKAAMASSNPEVRIGASASLAALAALAYSAFDELKNGLEDPDWRVREYATLAVCEYGILARPAVPSMIKNLTNGSALLRGRTVFALGYLGEVGKPAVPALVEMLRHPDAFQAGWTPNLAVEALSRILWKNFANEKEVLSWWKKTGKDRDYSGSAEEHNPQSNE